jgi:hypothetical protein
MTAVDVDVKAAELPLERLEAEITELAAHLTAAECRWVLLIGEYDRREGWREWGCRSCAHWLSWQCGLAVRAGQERVRVARALEELPLVTDRFAAGVLSYSKVRAITRVATPENEAKLVDLAEQAPAAQVERVVRAYRSLPPKNDETDDANRRHAARFLRYHWDDDGSLVGNFRMPPEMAAVFMKAVEIAREGVPDDPDDAEKRSAERTGDHAATNSDALMMMAEAFLAGGETRGHGDRFQVVINVDEDVLSDDADGVCELDGGPALAAETARRLMCGASIVMAMNKGDGRTAAAFHKAPAIPAATRRAVHARDHGCRFPGCAGRAFTHIHHVRHRAKGGGNQVTNLVELCWFHHRLVHEGGWNVRFDANGDVLAIRPNGNVLPRPKSPKPCKGEEIRQENRQFGLLIDPMTCIPRWYGDPLNLHEVVSGLVALEPN